MKRLIRRAEHFFVDTKEVRYENHKEMNETAEIKDKRHYTRTFPRLDLLCAAYGTTDVYELLVKTESDVESIVNVNKDLFERLKEGDRVNLTYQIDD
jgi:hypothetical protein